MHGHNHYCAWYFCKRPETGEHWWQKGGQFESELRRLVEGADGKLGFEPHIWDGLNSETSRRTAGKLLLGRLFHLEKKGERYCLIGHSHGGSAILSGLALAVYSRRTLPGLSNWITVGTPFISFARKAFLFSRLGLLGKAAYLSAFTFMCLWSLALWLDLDMEGSVYDSILAFLIAIIPFLLVHTLINGAADASSAGYSAFIKENSIEKFLFPRLRTIGRFAYSMGVAAILSYVIYEVSRRGIEHHVINAIIAYACFHFLVVLVAHFGSHSRRTISGQLMSLWLSLRHPQDEAVEGLRQLLHVSFPIFGRDFAVAPLTLASVIAFPALIAASLLSPNFMKWWKVLFLDTGESQDANTVVQFFTVQISWVESWLFKGRSA
jgi:hypothetical protein